MTQSSYPKANAPLETGEVWLELNNLIAVLDKPVKLDEAGRYTPFKILMKAIEQGCLNRAIVKDTAELIWERPQSSPKMKKSCFECDFFKKERCTNEQLGLVLWEERDSPKSAVILERGCELFQSSPTTARKNE